MYYYSEAGDDLINTFIKISQLFNSAYVSSQSKLIKMQENRDSTIKLFEINSQKINTISQNNQKELSAKINILKE